MNWLILRGWGRNHRHLGNFPELFTNTHGNKVTCIDLPGFGTESHRQSPLSIQGITDDLRQRWLTQGQAEPWSVAGQSLGGMVAVDWAYRYPQDFENVSVLNSSFRKLSPLWHRLKPQNLVHLANIGRSPSAFEREKHVLKMISNLNRENERVAEAWARAQAEFDETERNRLFQLLAATRFKPPRGLQVPLLVLTSAGDQMVDWRCSKKIANHFDADIRIHPFAGHDLVLDAPKWTMQQLMEFSKKK